MDILNVIGDWAIAGAKGLTGTAIALAITWYFVKRHEKARERKALGILGFQLAQILYWIWFFQNAGEEVRRTLDDNDTDANPWIATCISSFREKKCSKSHAQALEVAASAQDFLNTLGELPYEMAEWKWKADRLDEIISTVYLLIPTLNPRITAVILEPLSALQVVANDAAWQMNLAIKAYERLKFLALMGNSPISVSERKSLRGGINAGVIVTWRQMYFTTARVWDELQAALRNYPTEVKNAHDMVMDHLTAGMGERPPLATENPGPHLAPRKE